jgi:hypothetical protein
MYSVESNPESLPKIFDFGAIALPKISDFGAIALI